MWLSPPAPPWGPSTRPTVGKGLMPLATVPPSSLLTSLCLHYFAFFATSRYFYLFMAFLSLHVVLISATTIMKVEALVLVPHPGEPEDSESRLAALRLNLKALCNLLKGPRSPGVDVSLCARQVWGQGHVAE